MTPRILKSVLVACLLMFSAVAHGQYDRYWFEMSAGFGVNGDVGGHTGHTFKLKFREASTGFALIYSNYSGEGFLESAKDRESQEHLSPVFDVYGVSGFVSAPFKFGNMDAGLGVGYSNGDWIENCDDSESGWVGSSKSCDSKAVANIGIPLHASFSVGKYLGIGINADAFISADTKAVVLIGFVVPLGLFTE